MLIAPYFNLDIGRFSPQARLVLALARQKAATTSKLGQPEPRLIAPIHIAQALKEVETNGASAVCNPDEFPASGHKLYEALTPGACYFLDQAFKEAGEGEVAPLDFAKALKTVRKAIGINGGLAEQLEEKGIKHWKSLLRMRIFQLIKGFKICLDQFTEKLMIAKKKAS